MDLWKQAYQNEFGRNPDRDLAEFAEAIEAWREVWQAGFDAGEEWAVLMVAEAVNDALDVEKAG
jgi:hypothetical protein